jgi:thymidylate synthase (FAD)
MGNEQKYVRHEDIASAKLIAVTQPLIDGVEDAQELVAYCARVSNPSNQHNMGTAQKLVGYLKRHKHWSPFEMANAVVEINTPRDIARQIIRHKSFTPQEFSQRYADVSALESAFCLRECRKQDTSNRQNSLAVDDEMLTDWWESKQRDLLDYVSDLYRSALDKGIAKECARVVLPEGLTMSRLYLNGTIRSWIHYLEVRMEEGVTQKEHVMIARLIAEQVSKAFPVIGKET